MITNKLLLWLTLCAFLVTNLPIPCYSQVSVGKDDVAFAYKIEQLLEKVRKAVDKSNGNKLIDLMLQAKQEMEHYSGIAINLEKQLKKVKAAIKKQGVKVPKKEFNDLTKLLKRKEQRTNHKKLYLEDCLLYPEISYSTLEEQQLYSTSCGEDDEIVVPIKLAIGVSVALIGLFLIGVPVTPNLVKNWGRDMVVYGTGIASKACEEI